MQVESICIQDKRMNGPAGEDGTAAAEPFMRLS